MICDTKYIDNVQMSLSENEIDWTWNMLMETKHVASDDNQCLKSEASWIYRKEGFNHYVPE